MIVVDASIVVPALLPDERDWTADVARRLSGEALTAPAHWPVEVMNVLHVAERRGRIGRDRRRQAIEAIKAFGVVVAEMGEANWTGVSALAEKHRLTVYDAAYLHLALIGGAALATRDDELVAAARVYDLEVLTY